MDDINICNGWIGYSWVLVSESGYPLVPRNRLPPAGWGWEWELGALRGQAAGRAAIAAIALSLPRRRYGRDPPLVINDSPLGRAH